MVAQSLLVRLMRCGVVAALGLVLPTRPAGAQDRPFLFSVSTPPSNVPHATVHLETAAGERAFDVVDGQRLEQQIGVQAYLGSRVTLLARVGMSSQERDDRTTQQGELLFTLAEATEHRASLAAGLGLRHESAGTNVLLGRVVAGRAFQAWRVDGNALFEKPLSAGRDAIDLITSAGIARQLAPALYVGVEMIGEDLEGFWDATEADGGARLLLGPSVRIAPSSRRWQLSAAGGPVFMASPSAGASQALRSLPRTEARNGYALRVSFGYAF